MDLVQEPRIAYDPAALGATTLLFAVSIPPAP